MSPIKRIYTVYLSDILESMLLILEYIGEKSFDEFKTSRLHVDAVVRNFEIIGEASKNIPDEIKIQYPEVPWKRMYSLRNMISHEYFGIDYDILWEIANTDLPENIKDIERILTIERGKEDEK